MSIFQIQSRSARVFVRRANVPSDLGPAFAACHARLRAAWLASPEHAASVLSNDAAEASRHQPGLSRTDLIAIRQRTDREMTACWDRFAQRQEHDIVLLAYYEMGDY